MIYLYGDSFVENEPARYLGMHDHERWYQMMSKTMNEDHENHGKCGEGCWTTMDKFHNHLYEGRFKEDSKFVIVLSGSYRIPWIDIINPQHDEKYSPSDKDHRRDGIAPSSAYQDWKCTVEGRPEEVEYHYLPEEIYAIDQLYKCLNNEINRQNLKNVTYLKAISKYHNWPMIVFRVLSMSPDPFGNKCNDAERVKPIEDMVNDDDFLFWSYPLQDQSAKEWHDGFIREAGTINHFTHRNHVILSNIICNHFMKTDLTEKWHEGFIRDVVNQEHRRDPDPDKLVDFIYH